MEGINYSVKNLMSNEMNRHYLMKMRRFEAQKLANVNKQLNEIGSLNNLLFLVPLITNKKSRIKLYGDVTITNFAVLLIMYYIGEVTGSKYIHFKSIRSLILLMVRRTSYRNCMSRLKEQGYTKMRYIKQVNGKQSYGHYYITNSGLKLLKQHSRNLILESEKIIDKLTELAQNR